MVAYAADGSIDVVASDHATYNGSQKALGARDFTKIPVGINGVGDRMSVLWERGVHSGKMDPTQFVALTAANPAKLFNLYPQKGRIEVGAAADLVIWNPTAKRVISAKTHQLKADFNVFEGMEVHGVAETVICQGKVVVDEGQIRVMQGFGRFVPLAPFAAHVYDRVRAKEADNAAARAVVRAEAPLTTTNGSGSSGNGAIPPPTPPKSAQPERAPSQHRSSVDLTAHPNRPDAAEMEALRVSPEAAPAAAPVALEAGGAPVHVRHPPGGKSAGGFW